MEKTIWIGSLSGLNLKSKTCPEQGRRIQNPKWLGLSVIAFVLVVAGAVAQAQQPGKVPPASVSWIIALLPVARSSWTRSDKS
jgi:hypothetical protein